MRLASECSMITRARSRELTTDLVTLERGRSATIWQLSCLHQPTTSGFIPAMEFTYVFEPQVFSSPNIRQQRQFPFEMWKITMASDSQGRRASRRRKAEPAGVLFTVANLVNWPGASEWIIKFVGTLSAGGRLQRRFPRPAGYFLATKFDMRDKDVLFAANCRYRGHCQFPLQFARTVIATADDTVVTANNARILGAERGERTELNTPLISTSTDRLAVFEADRWPVNTTESRACPSVRETKRPDSWWPPGVSVAWGYDRGYADAATSSATSRRSRPSTRLTPTPGIQAVVSQRHPLQISSFQYDESRFDQVKYQPGDLQQQRTQRASWKDGLKERASMPLPFQGRVETSDPQWASKAEVERQVLAAAIGSYLLDVHHIRLQPPSPTFF